MICNCGGTTRQSTWETVDGWTHYADTCTACGRYHRWPSKQPEVPVCPAGSKSANAAGEAETLPLFAMEPVAAGGMSCGN